ncbi:fumarylacetoacetate hydrolase family protein [Aliikangiella coralliicola]|uniref:Fumarylacetoacetate hydrolase family protein n=1 Tax=Aliikangiella coralliicola TaxID=2592383 RepID=A0A545U0I5_9GAMM|nr:fumarylacetoacetate hydrolase family protein [Aliikangiella coralliicola]TQV82980.1 fumarylacetoacetate hydrolase family protein [Aliikangiella coralliicola]
MSAEWFKPGIVSQSGEVDFNYPTSKVVCVGRNYTEHAKELNNPVPESPILFIKPNSCLQNLLEPIKLPVSGECHHELEVTILIGEKATQLQPEQSASVIAGIGIGLDLTLRDVQQKLKSKGHPWERAKAFDGASPVSFFHPVNDDIEWGNIEFCMEKNGEVAQQGNTRDMIFPIDQLIAEVSQNFTLYAGDIIMTGTPKGVGALAQGDKLKFTLNQVLIGETQVV